MQQVQTEKHCAQGGKACARKAGSRLAALALALAMVCTTALPAFAEGDPGEMVDDSGTSTGETVPGTDPADEPSQGTSPDGSTEADGAPTENPSAPGNREAEQTGAPGSGTSPENSAAPGGQQPAQTSPDGGNTAAPDPDGNTANGERTPVNSAPEPEIMLTALSIDDQFSIIARCLDGGSLTSGTTVNVEITITNKGPAIKGDGNNTPTLRFQRGGDELLFKSYSSTGAWDSEASLSGDYHSITFTGAGKSSDVMAENATLTLVGTLKVNSSGRYSVKIRTEHCADLAFNDAELYFTLSTEPARTVKLIYHANYAGDGDKTVEDEPTVLNDKVSLLTAAQAAEKGIQQSGMVLSQWCTHETSSGNDTYAPGADDFPVPADTEQVDLYALWEPAPKGDYSITYHFIDPETGEYTTDVEYSETPSFTLRSGAGVGTPELGSTLNGRQVVGWHTVESSAAQNMTVDQHGKLEKETYSSGKAKHSSEFAALTALAPTKNGYGACGTDVTLQGTNSVDLYPVLGPAFGYTLTIAEGNFPSEPVPDTNGYSKDKRYTLGDGTVLMANGRTSAANAPKYVLFGQSFRDDDVVPVTTAVPVDDRDTADKYHFVGWFDKRARQNNETHNIIVLPGEEAVFGDTANVYSLDAIWFDMQAEDAHFTYDGETPRSVGLTDPVLIGTSDYDAEDTKEVQIDEDHYRYDVKYWADPEADTTTTPDYTCTTVTGDRSKLPKFVDAGTYQYTISVDVGIKVDGGENSYYDAKVQGSGDARYILKTFIVHATLIIDPVDLYISHTSTRYLVDNKPISVNFNIGHSTDSGDEAPVEVTGLLGGDKLTAYSADIHGEKVDLYQADYTAAAGTVKVAHESDKNPDGTDRPLGTEAGQNYIVHQDVWLRILDADVVSITVPFTKTLRVVDDPHYSGAVLPAGSYRFAFTASLGSVTGSDYAVDTVPAVLNVPAGQTSVTSKDGALYATFSFTRAGRYAFTLIEDPHKLPANVTNNTSAGYRLEFFVTGNINAADLAVTVNGNPVDLTGKGSSGRKAGTYTAETLSFVNLYTPPTGSLTLSKDVEPADTTTEFTFTVTAPVSGLGDVTADDGTTVSFVGNTAEVKLHDDDSLTLSNMPVGRYTVTETSTGYNVATEVTVNGGDAVTGTDRRVTAEVKAGGSTTVHYTNTAPTGSLTVSKTVTSTAELTADMLDDEFTFTVNLPDKTGLNGTYGDMNFTGGKATVTLKHGESATADGLPAGARYTVQESCDKDRYLPQNAAEVTGAIFEDEDVHLAFVNRAAGSLTIQKALSAALAGLDADTEFRFTVTAPDNKLAGSFTTDAGKTVEFAGGVAHVTVTGGGSVTIKGLPTGQYTVAEEDLPALEQSFTVTGSGTSADVPFGDTITVTVTNERRTGDLVISKELLGPWSDTDPKTFAMTVQAPADLAIDGIPFTVEGAEESSIEFTGNEATLHVSAPGSATIKGLPVDDDPYTVTEATDDDYTAAYIPSARAAVTDSGTAAAVTVRNTRKTGNLTVQKNVTNPPATAETYRFTVRLTGSRFTGDCTGSNGTVHFANGRSDTISITGSGSVTINDLPANVDYTVTEESVSGAKYTTYVGGEETSEAVGTITAGGTAEAIFTNVYPGTAATAVLTLSKTFTLARTDVEDGSALPSDVLTVPFRVEAVPDAPAGTELNGKDISGGNSVTVNLKMAPNAAAPGTETLAFAFPEAGEYHFTITEDGVDTTGKPYEVKPVSSDPVEVTYTVTMASNGTLTASQTDLAGDKAEFTNELTYRYPSTLQATCSYTVRKTLEPAKSGEMLPADADYRFTFTADADINNPPTGAAVNPAQVTVEHLTAANPQRDAEQALTFTFTAPGDYTYTVAEENPALKEISPDSTRYEIKFAVIRKNGALEVTPTVTAADGTSTPSGDDILCFTNQYRTGSLTVSKTVTPIVGTAPAGDTFAFTVTLTDQSDEKLPGRYTYTGDRSGTIASGEQLHLSDGQSVTIEGLPIGTKYIVKEDPVYQYTTAKDTLDGEIEGYNAPAEAAFTNFYSHEDWPVNDVSVTLAKTLIGPDGAPLSGDHGSFVIGMLYSWQDDVYSTRQPGNYTMIEVPVSLTLLSSQSIPDNNRAGYAFAFTLNTKDTEALHLGTGKWLLSVPASAFAGNTGEVTADGTIPVWVKNDAAASYTFTVTEDGAGENATYVTDLTAYDVTVTVDPANNKVTWSAKASTGATTADTLTFTNTYVGTAASGPPAGGPGAAPAASTGPTFGYFRLITLSYSNDPDSSYRQTVDLPVGTNGTTVHLFEVPTDRYAYEKAAFSGSADHFVESSEGGVLTIPAGTAGDFGTVTFTNRYVPDPVEMRVQTRSDLTAEDGRTALPADTYTFTYTLTGVTLVDGSVPGAPAEAQTLRTNGETASGTEPSITAVSSSFAVYSFAAPGTYTFTVTQDKGSKPGVTYDEKAQTVVVTVGYDRFFNLTVDRVLPADTNGRGATLLTFHNTYKAPSTPPPDKPDDPTDDTPDEPKPAALTATPVSPAPVRVPRTADDMPLGAVWALFGTAAAALAVLAAVWRRRRKNR